MSLLKRLVSVRVKCYLCHVFEDSLNSATCSENFCIVNANYRYVNLLLARKIVTPVLNINWTIVN